MISLMILLQILSSAPPPLFRKSRRPTHPVYGCPIFILPLSSPHGNQKGPAHHWLESFFPYPYPFCRIHCLRSTTKEALSGSLIYRLRSFLFNPVHSVKLVISCRRHCNAALTHKRPPDIPYLHGLPI